MSLIIASHTNDLSWKTMLTSEQLIIEHRHKMEYNILRSLFTGKDIFKERDDDEEFLVLLPPETHALDLSSKLWSMNSI